MASFAYYRLPHEKTYTLMTQSTGQPEVFGSLESLNGQNGFVIAPFAVSDDCPVILIHPDKIEHRPVCEVVADGHRHDVSMAVTSDRDIYMDDFAGCHAMLMSGEYRKIVLARSADIRTDIAIGAEELFMRACLAYPRMFVVLVHTPQSGTWLAATPEILLEGNAGRWKTVALAGTMSLEDGQLGFDSPASPHSEGTAPDILWSTKNIKEQRYVATYI
ncbi:MAG: chorismate-binding protein, partial [Prevotella sp.]|nr:chorismate-binding protein [Prevotella sp.]